MYNQGMFHLFKIPTVHVKLRVTCVNNIPGNLCARQQIGSLIVCWLNEIDGKMVTGVFGVAT